MTRARWRMWGCCAAFIPLAARSAEAHDSVPVGATLHSLGALALVLAAIVAAAWLLRHLQGGTTASNSLVKTIAATAVGPRERVVLVEIQDTWLVLGVAQGSVRMLHTLPRGEASVPTPVTFATWLTRAHTGQRRGG
ncbi:MAG: flagellar biosynthetic protein FliO [Burkholderiales bacterium]